MHTYRADLQIHSCLSPCGSLDNSPRAIIETAVQRGVDIIALTDHNTTANCPAFAACAARTPLVTCLFGAEVTTAEEVHVMCLFGAEDQACSFGRLLAGSLPPRRNDPEYFGDQPVVDDVDTILRLDDSFLAGAVTLSIDAVVNEAHARGGIVIASHIDRQINSVFSQLGIWPADVAFDAADLSAQGDESAWRALLPPGLPVIRSSDAHYLEDIGRQVTLLRMKDRSFEELRLALRGEAGRGIAGYETKGVRYE